MEIKAIVFDKDGTLIDFEQTFHPATVTVIKSLSNGNTELAYAIADALQFDLDTQVALPGSLIVAGSGLDFAAALQPVLEFEDEAAFAAFIDQLYGEICIKTVVALPGIEAALRELKSANFSLGICTNDAEANARSQMVRLQFDGFFQDVFGADSGHGPKPGPGMIDAFLAKVNHSPEQVLMVGDSLHDLEAGKAAGVKTCGVETGPAHRAELEQHADIVLPSVADLPVFLSKQSSD